MSAQDIFYRLDTASFVSKPTVNPKTEVLALEHKTPHPDYLSQLSAHQPGYGCVKTVRICPPKGQNPRIQPYFTYIKLTVRLSSEMLRHWERDRTPGSGKIFTDHKFVNSRVFFLTALRKWSIINLSKQLMMNMIVGCPEFSLMHLRDLVKGHEGERRLVSLFSYDS
jgi:hypothetical protein